MLFYHKFRFRFKETVYLNASVSVGVAFLKCKSLNDLFLNNETASTDPMKITEKKRCKRLKIRKSHSRFNGKRMRRKQNTRERESERQTDR